MNSSWFGDDEENIKEEPDDEVSKPCSAGIHIRISYLTKPLGKYFLHYTQYTGLVYLDCFRRQSRAFLNFSSDPEAFFHDIDPRIRGVWGGPGGTTPPGLRWRGEIEQFYFYSLKTKNLMILLLEYYKIIHHILIKGELKFEVWA